MVAMVARYMKVCMSIPSLLHLLGHEDMSVCMIWIGEDFELFSPPPPLTLLFHTCQAVLNPRASRSRVPPHHADNFFCDGDYDENYEGIAKLLLNPVCMFQPIVRWACKGGWNWQHFHHTHWWEEVAYRAKGKSASCLQLTEMSTWIWHNGEQQVCNMQDGYIRLQRLSKNIFYKNEVSPAHLIDAKLKKVCHIIKVCCFIFYTLCCYYYCTSTWRCCADAASLALPVPSSSQWRGLPFFKRKHWETCLSLKEIIVRLAFL